MKNLLYWFLAFLFVAGIILCCQDLCLFPWAHVSGIACIGAVGLIANKKLDLESG